MVDETEFLGLRFASLSPTDTIEWILSRIRADSFAYVVTPNVDHVVQLWRDSLLQPPYEGADLRLCDSTIIHLLAAISGISLSVVKGSDLTGTLLAIPLPPDTRICLIGGDARQVEWLERRTQAPIVHLSPPMGVRQDLRAQGEVVDFVEKADCGLVLIAIGAPQSEIIAEAIKRRGNAKGVALCIGASLEFLTGTKRRAPGWMQTARLEWAFRLISEPRRLWQRYLLDGPCILPIWLRWQRERRSRSGQSHTVGQAD